MSHYNLFQALIPYNYATAYDDRDDNFEEFESHAIMEFADSNGDGMISLYEYYFFVIFMQGKTSNPYLQPQRPR